MGNHFNFFLDYSCRIKLVSFGALHILLTDSSLEKPLLIRLDFFKKEVMNSIGIDLDILCSALFDYDSDFVEFSAYDAGNSVHGCRENIVIF